MANRKKSGQDHKLSGTYAGDRHDTVEVDVCQPEKPLWLCDSASREWDRVMPLLLDMGQISKHDQMPLAAYCELSAEFARNPYDFPSAKMTQLRLLMGDFGMTPSARAKIPKRKAKAPGNPYAEL